MFDFKKALEVVLNDPAVADMKPFRKRPTSSDRLTAVFHKVMDFYEANGRLPQDVPEERSIYHNWLGIIKSESKIQQCRQIDEYNLLPQSNDAVKEPLIEYTRELTEEERLEAVLNDPLFSDMQNDDDPGLFDIPDYMRKRLNARKDAEYVGKRIPCEDFEKYTDSFKVVHEGLKSGRYRLVKFSVKHLKVGDYFIDDGMIGYLAAFDDEGTNKHGDRDGRTRVIYENGTESDIKYKTITKNLSVTGYSVIDCSEMTEDKFKQCFVLNENDIESGTVYVLRTKSTYPEISAIKDLYKIGFTVTSVESRIANARKEPTYLCADVEVVATWKVYNVKSSTFEALIHKLFSSVQLQITVNGKRPKEWFIVPFKIIEEAINAIISGQLVEYNPQLKQLIYLS